MTGSHQKRIAILVISIIFLITISVSFILIGMSQASNGNFILGLIIILVGILTVTIGGISIRLYNQRTLTMMGKRDRNSTFIQYKAGYYSFVGSMYIIVMMMIFVETFGPSRSIFYMGLGCNFAIFILLHSIFSHKTDPVQIDGEISSIQITA